MAAILVVAPRRSRAPRRREKHRSQVVPRTLIVAMTPTVVKLAASEQPLPVQAREAVKISGEAKRRGSHNAMIR